MSKFNYSNDEMNINKVLKMNQDISNSMLNDKELENSRNKADDNIKNSLKILNSLGKTNEINDLSNKIEKAKRKITNRPINEKWEDIIKQANIYEPNPVFLEDIMTKKEIEESFNELKKIEKEFSKKTSIINKTDLIFLSTAIALKVVKILIFPYIAEKFHYGEKIDKSKRLDHDDPSIKKSQEEAIEKYKDKKLENNKPGYWINILEQTPAYDIINGSKDIGYGMSGKDHRLYTLGHDPILGWIFGTMNILTDIITFNDFQSYKITRKPMRITSEKVSMIEMFNKSLELIKSDYLNLPTAIFVQAQHLKSDKNTKMGLPIPIISTINEDFASKLYKENYDTLCFSRDLKIVGGSFIIEKIIDTIIGLVHGLFRDKNEPIKLYEIRTRKILLISNTIASTSSIINSAITKNPKNLDIGSLLNTVTRLFTDIRFITKIKHEFIENEISLKIQNEINEIDRLYEII